MSNTYNEMDGSCFFAGDNERKTTIKVYPNLSLAPLNNFAALIDKKKSKFKVALYDYSRGKGDNGVTVTFNLDIKTLRHLKRIADSREKEVDFHRSKIVSREPKNGALRYPCHQIYIGRRDNRAENPEQQGNLKQWYIRIRHGTVEKLSQSIDKVDQSTFITEKSAFLFLTEEDFEEMIDTSIDYLNAFLDMAKEYRLKPGLQKMEEAYGSKFRQPESTPYPEKPSRESPVKEERPEPEPEREPEPVREDMPIQDEFRPEPEPEPVTPEAPEVPAKPAASAKTSGKLTGTPYDVQGYGEVLYVWFKTKNDKKYVVRFESYPEEIQTALKEGTEVTIFAEKGENDILNGIRVA